MINTIARRFPRRWVNYRNFRTQLVPSSPSSYLRNFSFPISDFFRNYRGQSSFFSSSTLTPPKLPNEDERSGDTEKHVSPISSPKDSDEDQNENPTKTAFLFGMDRNTVKYVGILSASQLMLNFGFAQIVPVMPLFAAQMGGHLGAAGVGLIISAPALAKIMFNVPFGKLCDTIGRKPLMYTGTAITAVGTLLTAFSGSLWSMLPARFMTGIGSASSMTGSGAYMADLSDRTPEHRAKIMGINQALVGSVWVIGPALGGYMADIWGLQNSFIIAGIGAALCSLGYTQLPETLKKAKNHQEFPFSSPLSPATTATATSTPATSSKQDSSLISTSSSPAESATLANPSSEKPKKKSFREHFNDWKRDVIPIIRSPNQQALIAMQITFPLRFSTFTTVVALHTTSLGLGPKELGMMFTGLAISQGLGMLPGSYLADLSKGAKKWIIGPAGLASCAAFAGMAFATSFEHFLACMCIQGFCGGFTQPATGAFTAQVTPPQKRGQAMSIHRQAADVAGLVGPISFGLLADVISSNPAVIVMASGLMAMCHIAYLMRAGKPDPIPW